MTPEQRAAHQRLLRSLPNRIHLVPMGKAEGRPASPIILDGVLYDSMKECCEKLKLPKKKIYEFIAFGLAKRA